MIERSYTGQPAQLLRPLVCPEPYADADQWYQEVQCVHLHGSVSETGKPLTFSAEDFAQQTAKPNPWYQALIDDMQSKSVVFVGTRLADSPFYHYLTLRSRRPEGVPEVRAKCFLVAPQASPIMRREFERQGYVVLDATASEFFNAVVPLATEAVQDSLTIVKNRYPHQSAALTAGLGGYEADLLRQFDFVSVIEVGTDVPPRSMFLLGAEPTWPDIAYNVDALRGVSKRLETLLTESPSGTQTLFLLGAAGSGKSTSLRRTAYELARAGQTVYFSKALQRIDAKPVVALAQTLGTRRVFIFIDDGAGEILTVNEIVKAIPSAANVTFVIADQSHLLSPRIKQLAIAPWQIVDMPQLDQADCEAVLDKLQKFGLLGVLTNRSRSEQLREFLVRSRKQLLVAMKEATSGKGFNVIIAQEYGTLASQTAQFAYATACLAYMHGAAIRRRHLLACLDGSDYEKASILKSELTDVLLPWRDSEEFLAPRHRVIARQVIKETAPRSVMRDAITRFMWSVAADITPQNIVRRTPEYIAYRGVINLDNMLLIFGDDYETIDSVYKDLVALFGSDFLFWLQRGRAEVYFDQFETAQNYLDASLAIRDNFQAWHYLGVLNLKRAATEDNGPVAAELAERGEEILRKQITHRGEKDAYPYAALVEHKLRYLTNHPGSRYRAQVEELYRLAQQGIAKHPLDDAVRTAYEQAQRRYLMIAVPENRGRTVNSPASATSEQSG